MVYTWTPASLMPVLLPWLAMLALLMRKPNRSGQAWWIWVALGVVCGLSVGLPALFGSMRSELQDLLSQMFIALAFGVSALWLWAPSFGGRRVGMFVVLGGFSLFTYAAREDWAEEWDFKIPLMIGVVLMALALVLALNLVSFSCRQRFSPLRFLLCLAGWLLAAWMVILGSFMVPVWLMNGGRVPWPEFIMAVLVCAGLSLAVALPFLILSFAHPFYRDRLRALLQLPPVNGPVAVLAPGVPPPNA